MGRREGGAGAGTLPHEAIRRHLVLLPLYIVAAALAWQLAGVLGVPGERDGAGIVKGHDFAHFYALGTVARSGAPADLYDPRALTGTMWRVVPASRPDAFPPVYGPQVALAFIPLAALPYASAVWTWLALGLACYAVAGAIVVARVPALAPRRGILWVLLLGSPALHVLLVAGQTSAIALLAVTCAWWALERDRPSLAGACLGVLAFKPSLASGALVVLVLAGQWRVLAGMTLVAVLQIGIAAAWAGLSVMRLYAGALAGPVLAAGMAASQPQHLHSLAGFWRLLLGAGWPGTALYAATAGVAVLIAARAWRQGGEAGQRIALLALATVLAAPHLYVYDLVLAVPALVVLWERGEREAPPFRTWARTVAWLGWLTPLAGPLALATRIQWATPVLVTALLLLSRSRTADNEEDNPSAVRPERP